MVMATFHRSSGGVDFLGFRSGRQGGVEIVYDDGATRRMIWRVEGRVQDSTLGEALRSAVDQRRVLPALYSELKKRGVQIEAIG